MPNLVYIMSVGDRLTDGSNLVIRIFPRFSLWDASGENELVGFQCLYVKRLRKYFFVVLILPV